MSQREASRSGASPPADPAVATQNGHPVAALSWETVLPALSAVQQQSIRELIERQASPENHVNPTERGQEFFQRLTHGPMPELPALTLQDLPWFDAALDSDQRSAVAMAVQAPDVAVIHGQTGTGKTRLIAETIRQATRLGQRILFLSPTPAALDVVLERLENTPCGLPLRILATDEKTEGLPQAARNCTWAAYERQVRHDAVHAAEVRCQELEQRLARLQTDEPILKQLRECAHGLQRLQEQIEESDRRSAAVADEVRRAASAEAPCQGTDPFLCAMSALRRELEQNRNELDLAAFRLNEQRAKLQAEIQRLEEQIVELQPLAGVQERARWFSPSWWNLRRRAKKMGDVSARIREQQELLRPALSALEEVKHQQIRLEEDRQRRHRDGQGELEGRIGEEIQRRLQLGSAEKALLQREQAALEARWREQKHQLSSDSPQLAECTVPIHDACQHELQARISQTRSEIDTARSWREALPRKGDQILARLREAIQVVATPLSACADDKLLRAAGQHHSFDLVIVDDAHRLPDANPWPWVQRAARWVFVGESASSPASDAKAGQRRGSASSGRRGNTGNTSLMARLAQSLLWPIWQLDGQRLRCRMLPITADQRRRLEVEPVADSPEIELHILCLELGEPTLAEVTFPASFSLEHAKLFLFRELEEVPVPARLPRWEEVGSQIRLSWSEEAAGQKVEYAPGVCEHFSSCVPGRTIAICFNQAAGWDPIRAEQWIQRHTRRIDTGRTVTLHRWHRPAPALAGVLAELGIVEAPAGPPHDQREAPAVEFIPVPGFNSDGPQRRRGDQARNGLPRRLPALRGGAGFELDLADAKHRDRLPLDLRARLPSRGYVNLAEAQAILRLLDNQLEDWARLSPTGLHLAILTSYPAQAELMRRLLKQEAIAIPKAIRLTVEFAGDFQHRECELAILSLTRSHERRAVTFGDDPAHLRLALTRARRRVIFVGDPGTLCRRSQWEGPLDHLDEATAQREKSWVAALVKNLQSSGPASILLHDGPP
jgi:hypothetical protein